MENSIYILKNGVTIGYSKAPWLEFDATLFGVIFECDPLIFMF